MKKKSAFLISVCFLCSLSSCGETKCTGTLPGETSIHVEWVVGSTEDVPYEELLDEEMFLSSFEDYTSSENLLQLEGGTSEDAVVVKPFKYALANDTEVVAPFNIWQFPVVHDDEYIGFIYCDLRSGTPRFFTYEIDGYKDNIAPALNDALKYGSIAVFETGNGVYGIYEDNTVISLKEYCKQYDGNLTFKQINQGYNLITSEKVNDVIYTAE